MTRVVRRPLVWGGVAVVALMALAFPALSMRLGSPSINLPTSLPIVRTLSMIQRDFPGGPAPAQVVVAGPGVHSASMTRALSKLTALAANGGAADGRAADGGAIHGPITALPVGAGRGELISVPLAGASSGNSSGATATHALLVLRNEVLPATLGHVHGISYAVTGDTANSYDYASTLGSAVPLVFGLVAALAFIFAAGRVPVGHDPVGLDRAELPSRSALAYGLITIIFQQGHFRGACSALPRSADRARA